MRIKKTTETTPFGGAVVNTKNNSTNNTYSCEYINDKIVNVGLTSDSDFKTNIIHSRNLFDGQLELGSFTSDGAPVASITQYRNVNKIRVLPNTTYTTSINGTAQQYVMHYYDENGTWLSLADNRTGTFTTPANCYYVNFRCYEADSTSDFANLKVQVEIGSTATSYEEYVSPSIIVDGDEIYNKNNLEVYSTTEQRIGTWLDKPLYRTTIELGNLPNASAVNINHHISNIDKIVKAYGFASEQGTGWYIVLPNAGATQATSVVLSASKTVIYIVTGNDRSNWLGWATLEYTKTTD